MLKNQVCIKEQEIKEIRDMSIVSREQFKFIKEELTNIRENHLAHMQKSLESMENQILDLDKFKYKVMAWAAVLGTIAGILIQLAFKYL